MMHIVVAPDFALCFGVFHAVDKRCVVGGITEVYSVRSKYRRQSLQSKLIDHITARPHQPSFLLMQLSQLSFQIHYVSGIAPYVSRAPSPRASLIHSLVHGLHHFGVLAHAQVVIGTPYCNLLKDSFIISSYSLWELVFLSQNVDKGSVSALFFQILYFFLARL